jgi:microcin C transport system substrate-binding protein
MTISRICLTALALLTLGLSAPTLMASDGYPEVSPGTPVHALAMHDAPRYPPGFSHFDYVNPDAPKGGKVRLATVGGFDSFNPFINKGNPADVMAIYDSLTVGSEDEPFTQYGLIAKAIEVHDDYRAVTFHIDERARFHDGHPVDAEDVSYTFRLLTEQGVPWYKSYYGDVSAVEIVDAQRIRFHFRVPGNRELPLILGQMPVLPKHYWESRDFSKGSLTPPLGSGPYKIGKFQANRFFNLVRVEDYWAARHPVNKGRYNFGIMRTEAYRDSTVMVEALKKGLYDFRLENISRNWAMAYPASALERAGLVKKAIPNHNPQGMQGFVFNTRNPLFGDPKVREAIGYAFDFEWTNRTIFSDAYTRTTSFFANSEMAATGMPSEAELDLLRPYKAQLEAEVFGPAPVPPKTDGSGNNRENLARAVELLKAAGWSNATGQLVHTETGKPFTFNLMIASRDMDRLVQPFRKNLKRLGIDMHLQLVDIPQYINRLRDFDYDMIIMVFSQSNNPGNEQRSYWTSQAADTKGSRNYAGIRNPVVDALVEQLIQAETRQDLVNHCRALDRVLLSGHYVIPHYYTSDYRLIYNARLKQPDTSPRYSIGFDTWWIEKP